MWCDIKEAIHQAAEQPVQKVKKKNKNPWLSEKAIDLADLRREIKCTSAKDKIQKLNGMFQRQARLDTEAYMKDMCIELEHNTIGKTREFFKRVNEIFGKFLRKLAK